MQDNKNYNSIPREKFEFANLGERLHDQKFEDKPIGYFKDAWIRFRKNKASVVAAGIIIFVVLFSVFMPFFNTNYDATFMDPYYSRKGPKVPWLAENLGILDGKTTRVQAGRGIFWLAAVGIGAEHTVENLAAGEEITLGESMQSEYAAING